MSVVVTGATGQLGRLVVDHLLAGGVPAAEIVATGRQVDRLDDLAARGVTVAVADYEQPETLRAAFAGADVLLLVSGSEVGRRVAQHTAAIDAAKVVGVQRVVYTSAPHADTTSLVLAPDHKATEEALQASGLAWTLARDNWYTENYDQTLALAAQTGVVLSSTHGGRVASAPRDDYAAGLAALLTGTGHEGRTYELSGDVAWTFDEFAAAASQVLGREVVHRDVTSEEHLAALTAAGLDEGTAGFLVALDAGIAAGGLADATSDLRDLIGRPTVPLVDALRAMA